MQLARRISLLLAIPLLYLDYDGLCGACVGAVDPRCHYAIEIQSPDSAYASRIDCLLEVHKYARTMKARGYTVTGGFPGDGTAFGQKGADTFKYFCLPETVDPRGPKAK
jgi:hypothetical protein